MNTTPSDLVKQQALDAIAAFEKSTAPGLWDHLDKATILTEMRSRVRNPFSVNQGGQPFCGPASILFELIRKQPLRYVQICRDLFELGDFQATSKRIAASERLRHASQGNLQMGQADWMVLATLRDAENLLFQVDPSAPEIIRNLSGMTKSWEMKGWVREILGYSQIDYDHTYLLGDLKAMRRAADVIAAGGVAFALITARGFLNPSDPDGSEVTVAAPNHWIGIAGNISVQPGAYHQPYSGRVSFDAFTWAKKVAIAVNDETFKRHLWGIITGLPNKV